MTELSPHSRTVAEEGTDTAPTPPLSAAGLSLPKNWLAIIAFIWAGQAASMITSYAAGYAVVWYVTESTGSALMLAAMNIAVMLPVGLISPFGGIVADKHNRKLIMIAADGAVGIISLMAGLLILAGDVSIPLLLAVCIARAVGQAFHSPAMMAAMPMLVPDKHLLRINTLDQLLASVASIGAPAFGIFLYTTLGFSSVMFLDFAGACVAVLGLALAKIPTVVDATAKEQHVLANLRDGWRAIAKTRGLVLLIGGVTIGMMIFGPLSAVFPLMTYQHFGGDDISSPVASRTTRPSSKLSSFASHSSASAAMVMQPPSPRRPSGWACSWGRASLSLGAAASASRGSSPWQPWSWAWPPWSAGFCHPTPSRPLSGWWL